MEKEKEKRFINGVEIEELPTVGESLSIKTLKQGRRQTIKPNQDDSEMVRDKYGGVKKRQLRRDGLIIYKNNAKRIINFKFSTDAQKMVAERFISEVESNGFVNFITLKTLNKITISLSKKYKEF